MRNVRAWIMTVLTCFSLFATGPVNAEEYQLLRFRASWCGPCKAQKQVFDENGLAMILRTHHVRDRLLDIDESVGGQAAKDWNVKAIPTTILVMVTQRGQARAIKRWGDGKDPLMTSEQYIDFVNPATSPPPRD